MADGEVAPDPNPNPNPNLIIMIREVWADNLDNEMALISSVIDRFPNVSMDTEFPGVIFPAENYQLLSPAEKYAHMKSNVDITKIIQVGITLSDADGNLPDLGSVNHRYIWQFNFSDFDLSSDRHAPGSIQFLRYHGIDFERIRASGIASVRFGELIMSSALVCNNSVSWVTFQGSSDFGYLVKILTGRQLPGDLDGFLEMVRMLFGNSFYDLKYLMLFCHNQLHGGLDAVAERLGVNRAVGNAHQAGSDSLLTWQVFQRMRIIYFDNQVPDKHAGVLFGLNQ